MLMKEWIKSNHINHIKDLLYNMRSDTHVHTHTHTHTHTRTLPHSLINLYSLISVLILRETYLASFQRNVKYLTETVRLSEVSLGSTSVLYV